MRATSKYLEALNGTIKKWESSTGQEPVDWWKNTGLKKCPLCIYMQRPQKTTVIYRGCIRCMLRDDSVSICCKEYAEINNAFWDFLKATPFGTELVSSQKVKAYKRLRRVFRRNQQKIIERLKEIRGYYFPDWKQK